MAFIAHLAAGADDNGQAGPEAEACAAFRAAGARRAELADGEEAARKAIIMLRALVAFVAAIIILLFIFILIERGFSLAFQACINNEAVGNDVMLLSRAYLHCTGLFINTNYGAVSALATLIIAAFTFTLWIATSRQAELTREALIANKRAFVYAVNIGQYFEQDNTTGLYNWRFRPTMRNSGDTPTKNMGDYTFNNPKRL
jgi:hypothetical protein